MNTPIRSLWFATVGLFLVGCPADSGGGTLSLAEAEAYCMNEVACTDYGRTPWGCIQEAMGATAAWYIERARCVGAVRGDCTALPVTAGR